jgi:hypothetical protein
MVQANHAADRLQFTTDAAKAIDHADLIFIAVGTPPDEDGSADLRYVLSSKDSAMDAQVTRRLLRGLGANAYGQFVTVIVQLVGVPILLHAWGAQLYGEWLILFAIPAYLAMTDLSHGA